MSKTKTNDQFLLELKTINPRIVPEEPYINNHTKILCHCKACGNSWYARPNSLLRGYGCPYCAGNFKKNNSDFVKELAQINPDIEPLEKYNGNKETILCRCKICGNEWKVSPNNLLSKGHKCPRCSRQKRGIDRRKSNEEFAKALSLINPNITPLEPYITSQHKIKCKCNICGYVWSTTPNNLLDKGSRCPNCSHASTSIVEQILIGSFSTALGKSEVKSRDKETIGKELDIFIPNLNFAIEFGAWYWHKDRLANDNEKQRLCNEKDIYLLTIFEDCPEGISEQLEGHYKLFNTEISSEGDYHKIKDLIKSICLYFNIHFDVISQNWDSIIKSAIENAQKRDDAEFRTLLNDVNPSVEVLEAYERSEVKLLCKCKVCGHEWKALPTSLLRGHACPKCARKTTAFKKTIANEEFVSRLSIINEDVIPLEPYVRGDISIRCKCRRCGNEWSTKAHNLLSGRGCPKCVRAHTTALQSKPIRCVETGICYDSIADVYRKTGISNAHKCAKGYQKTAGGFHWEYIDE